MAARAGSSRRSAWQLRADLDELWNSASVSARVFTPGNLTLLPGPARRYLEHAVAPGTALASVVRLQMHGEIRIGRWLPFRAEQVIRSDGGMLWTATMNPFGIPVVRGFDRLVHGEGVMRWTLFGVIPLVTAAGQDITRSGAGRVQVESVWLPSMLCREDVSWTAHDAAHPTATVTVAHHTSPVEFTVNECGRPTSVRVARWGNPPPDSKHFRTVEFGGLLEAERTFEGYTIPTRVRVGWYPGTPEFASIGEFFRATIDDATFR